MIKQAQQKINDKKFIIEVNNLCNFIQNCEYTLTQQDQINDLNFNN